MTDFLDDIMNTDPTPQGKKIRYDFQATFPSMEETLDQENNGYRDYTNELKDYTHDQLVELIKQMDITAHQAAQYVQYLRKEIDALSSHIHAKNDIIDELESKQSRVRDAVKFLMGFANEDAIDDNSMDEE